MTVKKNMLWIKAAMKGISAAVIGALAVSLVRLAPHAAPDAFTLVLLVLTVPAMLCRESVRCPSFLAALSQA